ncbi:sucrose nonfermenting 4-like protein isoform X4 [Juglans microcarpa x Juglans regia]|uniref:sucrose nonfermenting 4-like protein isoform X4 n=1 Tax=Juglans microcarpa x Juglans regia TaxID=2249226 RepID=UPI001B7EF6C4|nr:sucrose nonfermenting 4-like protein isoform X4 [Juglans microcarpa x Juglans regia]
MFGPNMDSVPDAAIVPGTVLIPMRFVWKHGGNSVYLCGSFTQWSQLLPMLPVEGCDNVFQTVHGLMPGYHQYKFYVDGQWRYDESQHHESGEHGMVNTLLLATDYMDVDNEAFRRMTVTMQAQVADVPLTEVVPGISDTDLQASRQRISVFLSTHTAYELLPESGKVVALDVDLPVKQAFHILHEQLGSHASNLTEEELETHTISAWKEEKAYLNRQNDLHGRAFPRRLIHASPYDNLKDVVLKILQNEVATVPVICSSSEDGLFPQLLHLASLSGILKCVCRYFKHCASSLPILQLPICAIPVGTWAPQIGESNRRPLAMLRPSASLSSALNLLVQAQVSSVPIVDDNDSLLDVYCRSDITALARDRAYTHINLDEMTIHQALRFGQESYPPYEPRSQRCQMCLRSDSLHKVMERLANPGVRRLVIVEAGSKRVEGIVSLSDIFKFLLG